MPNKNRFKKKACPTNSNLISEEICIPNHSGIADHPETNDNFLRLDGTNVPTAAYLWTTDFTTSGDASLGSLALTGFGASSVISSVMPIDIKPGGDTNDYVEFNTIGNQTTMRFFGQNGRITADTGTIDFDDENLTTTGKVTCGDFLWDSTNTALEIDEIGVFDGFEIQPYIKNETYASIVSGTYFKDGLGINSETNDDAIFWMGDMAGNDPGKWFQITAESDSERVKIRNWGDGEIEFQSKQLHYEVGGAGASPQMMMHTLGIVEGDMLFQLYNQDQTTNTISTMTIGFRGRLGSNGGKIVSGRDGISDGQYSDMQFWTANNGTDTLSFTIDSNQDITFVRSLWLSNDNETLSFGATATDMQLSSDGTNGIIDVATTLRVGNITTNYTEFSATGDMVFVGSAGLCYGEIYAYDVNNTITITSSGIANKVQVTSFAVDGLSNNSTPDHTNDHITITKAGVYKCNLSIHAESTGGTAYEIGFGVYKNNGATLFQNCHAHREMSGGGGDTGSINMTGLIDLAVNDTIEVWCWNETNTNNIIIDDITLNLIQIGG